MKCPNCGAETTAKVCEYCGSEIVQDEEVVVLCPHCGGAKIDFKRERLGTATHSKSQKNTFGSGRARQEVSRTLYRTVGICRSCGCTWTVSGEKPAGKKRLTWLWILGWICIFPVPLTILILRKKEMKSAIKYGIIAAAWILYFVIGSSGDGGSSSQETVPVEMGAQTESSLSQTADAEEGGVYEPQPYVDTDGAEADAYCIVGGELGEYGVELVLNEDSEFPDTRYEYSLPAGTYEVTNTDTEFLKQLDILLPAVEKNSDGIEEQPVVSATMFDAGETKIVTIEDGQVVEIEMDEVWEFKRIA